MKTVLFNTQTAATVGGFREGTFSGIWNSALSKVPGWLPDHIVELTVIENEQPEHDPELQHISSQWQVDAEAKTYTLTWTVRDLTPEEIQEIENQKNWPHHEWAKRIVAPMELIMDDVGIKMYGWFQINGFPVVKADDTTVHLYCNTILAQHQSIVDSLSGAIYIEDSPWIQQDEPGQED